MRPLTASLFALCLAACGDATGILVEVSSTDLTVPEDLDLLRFEVTSNDGRTLDRTYPVEGGWPQSLTVTPASDADTDVTITVTAQRGPELVVRRVVRTTFERGATRRVQVILSRDCLGVVCAPGVDCQAGLCVDVPPPLDGGVDAGGLDAGGRDAGSEDGGARDAGGPRDAGRDAGGRDGGGVDAGGPRDGGVDAFVPFDAGPVIPRCTATTGTCAGLLVISELAYEGPGGASDEFVEIYNRGTELVDASGVTVAYSATTLTTINTRATLPEGTMIPAGGYYLVAAGGYGGTVTPDPGGGWSTGFAANRGAVLLRANTEVLDTVGWHASDELPRSEGTAIPGQSLTTGQSFERKANAASTAVSMSAGGADVLAGNRQDSGDNASDFVYRTLRDPQSSAADPEP